MGELLLFIVTVMTVAVGAYWLGRESQRDYIEFLLADLDAAVEMQVQQVRKDMRHPAALRVVKVDQ